MTDLYEIAKKQLVKVERINNILKKQNEEFESKLCESEKVINSLKEKLKEEKTFKMMEQKNEAAIHQQKMHLELMNKINELNRDREELREKLALYISKNQQISTEVKEQSEERKKLKFKDGKYEEMLARSEKLRK